MITETEIRELPLNEKIRVMELIWKSLEFDDEDQMIPDWHETELKLTEARQLAGLEKPMDWELAKEKLIKR